MFLLTSSVMAKLHRKFVISTVIGIYLEANAVPSLSVKWQGKTRKELTESVPFFRDVVTGACFYNNVHLLNGHVTINFC